MAPDDASLVFMRAFFLAQRLKAAAIRIEHLLAALDGRYALSGRIQYPARATISPGSAPDLPLSPGATAALEPQADILSVSLKAWRNVLLDAQRRGAT